MSLPQGINAAHQVLNILATTDTRLNRLSNAYTATGELTSQNMSIKAFEDLFNWRESFLNSSIPNTSPSQNVDEKEFLKLTFQLVNLCVRVIRENSMDVKSI